MDGYSAEQIAAYYLLNLRCWTEGSRPDDLDKLIRWCKGTVSAEHIKFILDEHFEKMEGGFWTSPKLDQMREGAMEQAARKSDAGTRAVSARWEREKQKKREPDTNVYDRTTNEYDSIPIDKIRAQQRTADQTRPENRKAEDHFTTQSHSLENSSGPSSANPDAERIARAANSTVDDLLSSQPESLTPVQKHARLKLIQLKSSVSTQTPAGQAA